MTEQDVTERATAMGWTPKEEFRGKPENWRTAEEFVQMAESSLPHLKGTLKTLESSNAELRSTISSMQNDFSEFVKYSRAAEERAYNRAVEDLKKQQAQAKADGDIEAYASATEELQKKIEEHPAITGKPTAAQQTPGVAQDDYQKWMTAEPGLEERWQAENTWVKNDPELFAYAQQMDQFLSNRDGLAKPRSFRLEEIARLVKERYPDKFGNPARKAPSAVEGDSGGTPSGGNGQSYNDLPAEAKAQCDKWTGKDGKGEKGSIKGLTREDYLKNYKWEKQYPTDIRR